MMHSHLSVEVLANMYRSINLVYNLTIVALINNALLVINIDLLDKSYLLC